MGSGGILSDCILIWNGSVDNIPDGFALCDGENETPDLRDRFVLCADGKYSADDVGGEAEVTLTEDEMPKHCHDAGYSNAVGGTTQRMVTAGTLTGTTSLFMKYAGDSQPHNNMPPYYALYYIMKL